MRILTAEDISNVDVHQIIKIFFVLLSAHMIPQDQNNEVFYINQYIN